MLPAWRQGQAHPIGVSARAYRPLHAGCQPGLCAGLLWTGMWEPGKMGQTAVEVESLGARGRLLRCSHPPHRDHIGILHGRSLERALRW